MFLVALLACVVVVAGAAGLGVPTRSAAALSAPMVSPPSPSPTTTSPPSAPLQAPKTTNLQDTKFFTDVAEADSTLASYEQKRENVALRVLLTDGSAFCALLTRGRGLDEALLEEAEGARGTESQTHLPLSVTTFNTIESVALLTLCPAELKLVPASVRSKIRSLGKHLPKRSG
jgi:hypothetical protein